MKAGANPATWMLDIIGAGVGIGASIAIRAYEAVSLVQDIHVRHCDVVHAV
jgi:hypothetical protein